MTNPDHQEAIVSEKLKLSKASSLKAEQKRAGVGVLNTDAWLSGSVVEVLVFPNVEDFDIRFQSCWVSQSSEVASTSATTGFKLAFKKQGRSTTFQIFNAHFAQTLWNNLDCWKRDRKTQIFEIKVCRMCWIPSTFCPLNDHLQYQQQSPEHDASSVLLRKQAS